MKDNVFTEEINKIAYNKGLIINKRESPGLEDFNDFKVFSEYSNYMYGFIKTLKNTTQIKNVKY